MSIHWETYQKIHEFLLLDAAFLWLEIEPTKEGLESPPHCVEARRKLLNDEINRYYKDRIYSDLRSYMKRGLSEIEAINEYMRSDENPYHLLFTMGLTEHQDDQEEEKICQYSYTLADRLCLHLEHKEFSEINSETLKEIAKRLSEKPKFLFPGMVKDIAEVTPSNNAEKPLPTKRRNSYLKLIKGLLKSQRIDLSERGIAKRLVGIVKDAKQSLEDDTIRDILKEVQDLEADD